MLPGQMPVNWLSKLDHVNTHTSEHFCTGLTNKIEQKSNPIMCKQGLITDVTKSLHSRRRQRRLQIFRKILYLKHANRHIVMDLKD